MNIREFYKYSWFSTLAYVDWRDISQTDYREAIKDANNAGRLPGNVDTTNKWGQINGVRDDFQRIFRFTEFL